MSRDKVIPESYKQHLCNPLSLTEKNCNVPVLKAVSESIVTITEKLHGTDPSTVQNTVTHLKFILRMRENITHGVVESSPNKFFL